MYSEFYGLIRPPFEMTPDPSFLYLGEAHRVQLEIHQFIHQQVLAAFKGGLHAGAFHREIAHAGLNHQNDD